MAERAFIKRAADGFFIGYLYRCEGCKKVLADTSKLPDGRTRGDSNPGGFFAGRRLEPTEVEPCACGAMMVLEEGVADDPNRFQRWLEDQEKHAKEVADILKPLGFEFYHTGGGCTAWVLRGTLDGKKVEAWSTDGDTSASEKLKDPFMFCLVPADGEDEPQWDNLMFEHTYRNVTYFLRALKRGDFKLPTKEVKS